MSSAIQNARFLRDLAARKKGKVIELRLNSASTHPGSRAAKNVAAQLREAEIDAGIAQGHFLDAQTEVEAELWQASVEG